MKSTQIIRNIVWRAKAFRLVLNILMVAFMLMASFGAGFASSGEGVPPGERFAADPYELWQGEFLDFAPPSPKILELLQPDGAMIQARLTPMETGGKLETPGGYTILKNGEGWWTFAELGDGYTNPV